MRAYQKQLNRKGTVIELAAMRRATLLSVRAELAALDPDCSAEQLVRLDRLAHEARSAMFNLIGRPQRREPAVRPAGPSASDHIAALLAAREEAQS